VNPCIVVDCGSARSSGKLCPKHYQAEKRGAVLSKKPTFLDSIGLKSSRSAKSRNWLLDYLKEGNFTEECVEWPFGRRGGYGLTTLTPCTGATGAHVAACVLTRGPRPTPSHQAAHSCGNQSCVNPRHLRWATAKQNEADKKFHGTQQAGEKHYRSQITNAEALSIAGDTRAYKEIAAATGASLSVVKQIKSGSNWSSITGIEK